MRNRRKMFLCYALFSALLTASSAAMATTLTVKVLDESGFPATARVYLTDEKGKSYFPSGVLVYKKMNWNVPEEHFFTPGGSFSIELPKNTYSLRIERGSRRIPDRVTHSLYCSRGPEYLLPSARLAVYFWPRQFGGDAIVKEVPNSKVTTQEVADILGIHISDLRRMMRQGKIAAPPILFDPKSNSTGRMWSQDDIEAARAALKTGSADS